MRRCYSLVRVYAFNLKTGRTKVLYYFGGGTDSAHPYGALVNVNGTLYGTAYSGGAHGSGTRSTRKRVPRRCCGPWAMGQTVGVPVPA
ncbi:MAG TPA: hypothetical protein VHT03_06095 [Rhizomicrobium sp.]|jgi:hypothetical protein|nr:hypothetical protein [Rhizomicrobium sp.]